MAVHQNVASVVNMVEIFDLKNDDGQGKDHFHNCVVNMLDVTVVVAAAAAVVVVDYEKQQRNCSGAYLMYMDYFHRGDYYSSMISLMLMS